MPDELSGAAYDRWCSRLNTELYWDAGPFGRAAGRSRGNQPMSLEYGCHISQRSHSPCWMNSTARTRIPPRTHFPQGDHRREGHALQVTRRPDIQAVERLPRKKGHRYGAPGRNTETNLTKQRHVLCQQADRDIMCLFLGLVPKQTTNGRHKRGTTTRQERLVSDLCRSCRRRDTL